MPEAIETATPPKKKSESKPEPVVEAPKSIGYDFTMPGGYLDKDGNLLKDVTMVEMTGQDEENISHPIVRKNGGKVITTLLANCVKTIGQHKVTEAMIKKLLIGDRDFLMLKLRQISLGDDIEIPVQCKCSAQFEVKLDLNDFEIVGSSHPHDPIPFKLGRGYTDQNGVNHDDGEMKLPTGHEQEYLSSDAARNPGVASTALLTRCCLRLGKMKSFSQTVFRELNFKDRQTLGKLLGDGMPGPKLEATFNCPDCGKEWIGPLAVADFFTQ